MHSVTRTIFPVFAFKVAHRVILLTRFCKLLTRVAKPSGGVGGTCLKCLNGTTLLVRICPASETDKQFSRSVQMLLARVSGTATPISENGFCETLVKNEAQIPLGSSRHVSTCHVRRFAPVELVVSSILSACRSACRVVLFDRLYTAKMHGFDTSNV